MKGILSWHGASKPQLVRCFQNLRDTRTRVRIGTRAERSQITIVINSRNPWWCFFNKAQTYTLILDSQRPKHQNWVSIHTWQYLSGGIRISISAYGNWTWLLSRMFTKNLKQRRKMRGGYFCSSVVLLWKNTKWKESFAPWWEVQINVGRRLLYRLSSDNYQCEGWIKFYTIGIDLPDKTTTLT